MDILAPINSKVTAYPYEKDHNFGPYGLSYADDRWELRHAVKIRMTPKNADHPYHHKDIYIDKQIDDAALLASPTTARKSCGRSSGTTTAGATTTCPRTRARWYAGWEGVAEPRDSRVVSDTIVNVQTGTGNRIEFWDNARHAAREQGQDPPLHRRRPAHQGPLVESRAPGRAQARPGGPAPAAPERHPSRREVMTMSAGRSLPALGSRLLAASTRLPRHPLRARATTGRDRHLRRSLRGVGADAPTTWWRPATGAPST